MKIQDILTESQQVTEGPVLNKIGTAVGKGVGTLAKGVGAVAGGVAGLGRAIKKGYQAGKQTVGGAGDDDGTGDTASGTAPAAAPQTSAGTAPAGKAQPTAQTSAPAAAPAQQPQAKAARPAAAKPKTDYDRLAQAAGVQTAEPRAAANDTAYAQAQKAVRALPPEQQKELVALLQADPKVKAAMTKPAAPKTKAPAATAAQPAKRNPNNPDDLGFGFDVDTGLPLKSQAEKDANIAKRNAAAAPAAGTAEPVVKGKKKSIPKKKVAPTQAEIDADRNRIMGPTSDSVIRTQPALSESFSFFKRK